MAEKLALLISDLREKEALSGVARALEEGADPIAVVEELRRGMAIVGERFDKYEYYLSEMMMSAEIFVEAVALIGPYLGSEGMESKGSVVIGTVEGDIHDIGKNIVATLLRCAGYSVHDLGADQPPGSFIQELKRTGAGLLALSGLLTPSFDSMKRTVDSLVEAGIREAVKIMIGGASVNERVLQYTGADAYGKDASQAVRLADEFAGK